MSTVVRHLERRRLPDRLGTRLSIRLAIDVLLLLATAAAAYALWPASLGGSSRIIVVQGHSMEPTYQLGDLLLVRTDASPEVGDVVVFRIPADEPGGGSLVVHRIIGRRADGSAITQGDNRTTPDPYHVRPHDIVGRPLTSVPHGGRLIGLASRPTTVGLVSGLLATMLLWPGGVKGGGRSRDVPHREEEDAKMAG